MANDGLNSGLSPEQLQRLGNVLAEAKSLTAQQEEILKRVLDGETDIGTVRIAKLKEFFDIYSTSLDNIARKCSSLSDSLLITGRQLEDNLKKVNTGYSNTKVDSTSSGGIAQVNAQSASKPGSLTTEFKTLRDELHGIKKAIIAQSDSSISSSGGGRSGGDSDDGGGDIGTLIADLLSGGNNLPGISSGTDQFSTVSPDKRSQMTEVTSVEDIRSKQELSAEEIETKRAALREALFKKQLQREMDAVEKLEAKRLELMIASTRTKVEVELDLEEYLIEQRTTAVTAELKAQELRNQLETEIYARRNAAGRRETAKLEARKFGADEEAKSLEKIKTDMAALREKKQRQAAIQYNGKVPKKVQQQIEAEIQAEQKARMKSVQEITLARQKLEQREQEKKEAREKAAKNKEFRDQAQGIIDLNGQLFGKNGIAANFKEFVADATANGVDENQAKLYAATQALSSLAKQLEGTVNSIASYKGAIDTRLQGSNNARRYGLPKGVGSYWDKLNRDMIALGAVTPFFKQEDFAKNIKTLVDSGIAFDIKERAFLMTIKDKIATTFNAADGTLTRLIRLQQEDSTAGRLGMESAINTFLNNMYENTEYLQNVASSVRSSLAEMEALMEGAAATEVEFQVQKWMGSLYSVGMSDTAVNAISGALGQIAAGQIEGLTGGSGAGNLLVMAANNAGLSISDMLATGLDASEMNKLLQATVNYLAEIAEASAGNNVVQQQLANVFGVKASDLRAATNLASENSIGDIYKHSLGYDNMVAQLYKMAATMGLRTSMGEMMENVWANAQYSVAGSMANNPVSYLLYKTATLLDNTAGGITVPDISVVGNGVALNTTVADLMRVGALGNGILGSLGAMINGLASSFSGTTMLYQMGIKKNGALAVTPRGEYSGALAQGGGQKTTSESGYIGNSSSSDIKNTTMQEAEDSKKELMIEAQEEAGATPVDAINATVLKMYELLDEVSRGNKTLSVKVAGYGLTNNGSGSGAQGGVSGLLNSGTSSSLGNSSLSSSGTSDGFSNSSMGGAVDLGGWTMM